MVYGIADQQVIQDDDLIQVTDLTVSHRIRSQLEHNSHIVIIDNHIKSCLTWSLKLRHQGTMRVAQWIHSLNCGLKRNISARYPWHCKCPIYRWSRWNSHETKLCDHLFSTHFYWEHFRLRTHRSEMELVFWSSSSIMYLRIKYI